MNDRTVVNQRTSYEQGFVDMIHVLAVDGDRFSAAYERMTQARIGKGYISIIAAFHALAISDYVATSTTIMLSRKKIVEYAAVLFTINKKRNPLFHAQRYAAFLWHGNGGPYCITMIGKRQGQMLN